MGHAPCINNCVTSSSVRPLPIQLQLVGGRWEEGASRLSTYKRDEEGQPRPYEVMDLETHPSSDPLP
jgi:hypothetical protein